MSAQAEDLRKALTLYNPSTERQYNIPEDVVRVMKRAKEIGWHQAEAYYLPRVEFKFKRQFPGSYDYSFYRIEPELNGWKEPPSEFFWTHIKDGTFSLNSAIVGGHWLIIDSTQKPDLDDGDQMYENDPFDPILEQVYKRLQKSQREEMYGLFFDEIHAKKIPCSSRFGISADELKDIVNPAIADLLGIEKKQVRQPKYLEFNILGNLVHPEWGYNNSSEWFHDKGYARLPKEKIITTMTNIKCNSVGGNYENEHISGLRNVHVASSDFAYWNVGFRPLIVFPDSDMSSGNSREMQVEVINKGLVRL